MGRSHTFSASASAAGGTTAISQAATFGYPAIVRALIAAGASAGIRDSNGVNLLHWAAITDRPQMIPTLVQAGVSINDVDDFVGTIGEKV